MPIGSYANLYYIADELQKKKPKSVLDLGVGFGMNGVLVRQYVDLGCIGITKLTGIEVFTTYSNPVWGIYDVVYHCTIANFFNAHIVVNETNFDFILLTDVIEHFPYTEGVRILKLCMHILAPGGILLVSTPGVFIDQGPVNGNDFERHLSYWTSFDFIRLIDGWQVIKEGTPDQYGHQNLIMKYTKP
jgi:predicted SAM-dependent methyltransferase